MVRTAFREMVSTVLRSSAQARPKGVDAAWSVDDLRRLARRRLPRGPFDYMDGGAEDEVALAGNRRAFDAYRIVGRALRDVSALDTTHTVLGTPSSMPVVCSPTGFSRVFHHDGERAVARAASDAGLVYTLSTLATATMEDVAAAGSGPKWFQLYVFKDRAITEDLVERARACGYDALVLTVDTPVAGRRERDFRNGFTIPPTVGPRALLDGARKPSWWLGYLRAEALDFAVVSRYAPAATGPGGVMGYINSQFDQSLSWSDAAAIRERWGGRFVVKGIQCADDAVLAADIGADAVMLSNHGGRQLDHAVAPLELLPDVVDRIGGRSEVIVDGGIRRGTDILKAMALGADACALGRAYLYGLGAGGQAGVRRALELLHQELRVAMTLAGCRTIGEIDAAAVRRLG